MGLNFTQATQAMRDGQKLCRGAWMTPHQPSYVVLVPGREITVSYEPMVSHLGEGRKMIVADHIDAIFVPTLFPESNEVLCQVGYTLSQEDLLATDWFVVTTPEDAA